MCSWFVHVTNGVGFSVVKKEISALQDFQHYFKTSKADDLSLK